MFEHRNYVIFDATEIPLIDFSQVMETSENTLRKTVDGTKTFVKWEGETPACVEALTTKGDYLTHQEMLEALTAEEWNPPMIAGVE